MTDTAWHPIGPEQSVAEGVMTVHSIGGWQVLVTRSDGTVVALNDRCTHAAARLSTGRIRRGMVMCPLHGARFTLADGACVGGAYPALRRFALRSVDGRLEVAVPIAPPGWDETPAA